MLNVQSFIIRPVKDMTLGMPLCCTAFHRCHLAIADLHVVSGNDTFEASRGALTIYVVRSEQLHASFRAMT